MAKEQNYTKPQTCGHCGANAAHLFVHTRSQVKSYEDERTHTYWESGPVYDLLECTSCQGIALRKYFWHDHFDPNDIKMEVLYPVQAGAPAGLPDEIARSYDAAMRVRAVDANSYGVLIGRLLELICLDRGVTAKTLHEGLSLLVKQGDIPQRVADAAAKLRGFRNVGAHAVLGELTPAEIPILDDLSRAIVEYVYSLPSLIKDAENQLSRLKTGKKKTKKSTSKKKPESK